MWWKVVTSMFEEASDDMDLASKPIQFDRLAEYTSGLTLHPFPPVIYPCTEVLGWRNLQGGKKWAAGGEDKCAGAQHAGAVGCTAA